MNKQPWHPIDMFARDIDIFMEVAGIWTYLNGLRGEIILPSRIAVQVQDQADEYGEKISGLPHLSRQTPLMIGNKEDLRYAKQRNPSRPFLMVDGNQIRVLLPDGIERVIERNIAAIEEFVNNKEPPMRKIKELDGKTIGIVYMAFGVKAARGVEKAIKSLKEISLDVPITVVGDAAWDFLPDVNHVKWPGQSPFDPSKQRNFQFRAGRIKPGLYALSPYDYTLYIDADTEFLEDILPGFEILKTHAMAVTEEKLTLGQLYNKKLAGWEINIQERDQTILELDGDAKRKFLNSGVIFFRKDPKVKATFEEWGKQWQRFQEWDEQLAFMRAIDICKPDYKALSVNWNDPQRDKDTIIFHNYGRGVVRTNKREVTMTDDIPSWTSEAERAELTKLAAAVPDGGSIVEIGCLYGGTTAVLAQAQPKAMVTSIDNFSWSPIENMPASYKQLMENMEMLKITNVKAIEGDSRVVGKNWKEPIDLLWIDGGHSYEFVLSDLTKFGPYAKVIALHDWENPGWPTIKEAVKAFLTDYTEWQLDHTVEMVAVLTRKK